MADTRLHYTKDRPQIVSSSTELLPAVSAFYGPWNSKEAFLKWFNTYTNISIPSGVLIGIKQGDGTVKEYRWQTLDSGTSYLEENLVGTISSDNVTIDNEGTTLTEKLNSLSGVDISGAKYFTNIEALKASTDLAVGDIVITKGYYKVNDGGGSMFRVIGNTNSALVIYEGSHTNKGYAYDCTWSCSISGESTPYVDDATLVALQNDLYADIIVPANGEVSFLQMGAVPVYSAYKVVNSTPHYYSYQEDNKPYMMKWLAFNDRRMTTYTLYVPTGVYSFSETFILRNQAYADSCGLRIRGESTQFNPGATMFIPHVTKQAYILRFGYKTDSNGNAVNTAYWRPMRGVVMNNIAFGTTRYAYSGNGYIIKHGTGGISMSNDSTHIVISSDGTATTGSDGYRYVTKGAIWLDACIYSQFDGLYFTHVAGSSMYLTQCYETHFGYMNIRQCGRTTSSGRTYPMIYINAPGASDVSACYFYYFNFEACEGPYFYSKTSNFSHNEFNNIQIEGSVPTSLPTIKYTTDGTTPTFYSSTYSSSLSLPSSTTTYKARVYVGSTSASKVSTVIYDPSASVLPPAIKFIAGGVRMYCATSGATIYYTTDGTEPTAESTEYTGEIANPTEETVFKAIAVLNGVTSTVSTSTFATGSLVAPSIRVGSSSIVMRKVYKGSPIFAGIDKAASSTPYDTDSDYTVPTFTEDGETTATFGRWYKWFVFTGNIGQYPNYVNSITASNFGNGFKKYRTYAINDDNTITDIDGNTITENYVIDNGICYALDGNGNKIVDYYRFYALIGEDEADWKNPGILNDPRTALNSLAITVGNVYLYGDNTEFHGPWVVYLRNYAATHAVTINHLFDRNTYPYFLRGTRKINFAREGMTIPGAISFADMLVNGSWVPYLSTLSGAKSPNGAVVKKTTVNAVSFTAMPNVQYAIRIYIPSSAYNDLNSDSSNNKYITWTSLLGIGSTSTAYSGTERYTVANSGWVYINLPAFDISTPTTIYFTGTAAWIVNGYLDCVVITG